MIRTINTAVSGLLSAQTRATVAASNIVNANTASRRDLPPEASSTLSASRAYQPQRVVSTPNRPGGGVRTDRVDVTPSQFAVFSPNSPLADSEGLVNMPNVSLAEEIVQLKIATNTYKANIAVIEAADEMLGSLLDAHQ